MFSNHNTNVVVVMHCKSREKERKSVEDSVYYHLRLKVVSLTTKEEALPCIQRDFALLGRYIDTVLPRYPRRFQVLGGFSPS